MTPTDRHKSPDAIDTPAREFVLWLLKAVGLHVQAGDGVIYEIALPPAGDTVAAQEEHPYAELAGRRFAFDKTAPEGQDPAEAVEYATWQSPLVRWLLDELRPGTRLIHAVAAQQPLSVHELAEHLFAQYKVDDGHIHLAGCSLEDRPFLRLSYLQPHPAPAGSQLTHCFGTDDGELLDPSLQHDLDLHDLVPMVGRTPRIDEQLVWRWSDLIRQQFEPQTREQDMSLVAVALVWCKHAEGKLTFSIGQRSVEVPFAGWGRMFADRRSLPPPYECPLSGRSSYHLGATDDGRITVVEAIATCAESSRRVLENELGECTVTHKRVLPEYLQECPCTGELVLRSVLETCSMCQQQVSPEALVSQRCAACRQLKTMAGDDPRLERVLVAYPLLKRLRTFKVAETRAAQILTGSSTWKRLLIVLGKPDFEILHVATCRRLSNTWTPVPQAQRGDWLGSQSDS